MANMARLYQVSRAIRRYPRNSNQSRWHATGDAIESAETVVKADDGQHPACGTTLCAAGWTSFLFAPEGSVLRADEVVLPDGTKREIEDFAIDALGLTRSQSQALFFTAQDADDIDVAIDALEENPGIDGFDLRVLVRQHRRDQRES